MSRVTTLACAALVGTLACAGAVNAQSTTRSSSTNSCPSQQSVMTSSWSGATSTPNGSYLCAQEYHQGDVNVDTLDTSTFNVDTNVMYFPTYHCWSTTKDDAFSITDIEVFGAGSVSATNWDDTNHHWGAGWLFTLGAGPVSGFTNGCKSTTDQVWEVPPSILRLSSISASGLPDGGASKAGVQYTVTVTASPSGNTAGYQTVLQDNGQNVAVGTFNSSGTATFKWTPAEMGSRRIQVAWPGNGDTMGNITDAYTVDVSGGMAVKFDTAPSINASGVVTAKVDLDTSPDPFPTGATAILIDATTQKAVAQPVAVTPPPSGSSTSETFQFMASPGRKYNLVAIVKDSAGSVIGQSYVSPFSTPSVLTPSVPGSVYVGNSTSCPTVRMSTSIAPSTATGTVTFTAGGISASGTFTSGTASMNWCPPATAGTYDWTMSYGGDAATAAGSASGSIVVNNGGLALTLGGVSVNKKATIGGSGSASLKVNGTVAGTVYVTNSGAGNMGSTTATGSSATVPFTYTGGTDYVLVAREVVNQQSFYSAGKLWTGPANVDPGPQPQVMERHAAASAAPKAAMATDAARARRRPGGAPGSTAPADGVVPVNTGSLTFSRSRRVTAGARSVSLNCPKGYAPLHADGSGSGPATGYSVAFKGRKATITSSAANAGHRMSGNVMCRATSSGVDVIGAMVFGTVRGDTLVGTAPKGVVFAGPGRDRVRATGDHSVAWGGFGNDRMVIAGTDSVAAGGPGRDRLLAMGSTRMLLIGGQGRDVLIGGTGRTSINAADGKGDDRIICRSSSNRVRMDPGDRMTGPCTMVGAGG